MGHLRAKPRSRNRIPGLTLVEIMVAIFVLTVGTIGFLGAFGGISKSIRVSKAQTIATNLAQEEVESLKNLSYYRLLVTSSAVAATEPGLGGFFYDDSYYPPEDLVVGQIRFQRRVLVQKVSESGGAIIPNTWNATDTGLKLITAYVVWQEGSLWRKIEVRNLRDNPNRQKLDAEVNGDVRSGGVALQDASVYTQQNILLGQITDASGDFSFNVPAGTYDFQAEKRGYFPQIFRATASASAPITINFTLSPMGTGSVQGFAYKADHLVISEICATVDGDDQVEYYEIYNPTNQPFTMHDGTRPAYRIEGQGTWPPSVTMTPPSEMIYVNNTIQPHGFFLFASTPNVKGVPADAYYSDATRTIPAPVDRFPKEESAGLRLVSEGINESSGTVIDAIGWGRGGSPYGPSGFREGDGLQLTAGPAHGGLQDGETIERVAYSTATHSTMHLLPALGIHFLQGNGYDSDDNATDFVLHNHADSEFPQGTTFTETPGAGTPAIGAAAFMDDGLSASALAIGTPTPGSFTVTNVATGTWTLLVSSGGYVYEQANVVITAGNQVNVGAIFISTPASQGYVSGRVMSGGAPLNNIRVESSFGSVDYTDTNGHYRFQIDVGTHIVTANPGNLNTQYTTGEATGVVVNAGEAISVPDIFLFQGGTVRGFISSNGTDPLPSIPVLATNASAVEVGATVTDGYGYFQFSNLPIGTYNVTPQLEPGESASPTVMVATVTAGGNIFAGTMTVTNAFGTITGTVRAGATPITTGVLIIAVASPDSIPGAYPPTNDQVLRNGSTVYYICSSDSDGTYSLPVRGGYTYNVYGWYTTFTNGVPNPQKRTGSATLTAGGTAAVAFTW